MFLFLLKVFIQCLCPVYHPFIANFASVKRNPKSATKKKIMRIFNEKSMRLFDSPTSVCQTTRGRG
eukprot:UN23699